MGKRKRPATPEGCSDPVVPDGEYPTPKRAKVKALDRANLTREAIKKETGVHRSTQSRWLNQAERRPGKERSGRPLLLNKIKLEQMIRKLQGRYNERTRSWEELATDQEFFPLPAYPPLAWYTSSARTVQRYFNNAGFHKCRAC